MDIGRYYEYLAAEYQKTELRPIQTLNRTFMQQKGSSYISVSVAICFRHTDFRRPNKSIDQACLHEFWPANIATEPPILRTLHALIETASSGLVANQKRFFKIRLAPVRAIGRLLMLD